jgi:glucose/arabinose dehydrogenase
VVTTVDGVRLRASAVADGLEAPTDLAFAPDGRIFVAERAGRIRVVKSRLQPAATLVLSDVVGTSPNGLLAITLDPRFERNGRIYAAYTAASGLRVARFRSIGDTLDQGTILLDGVRLSTERPATSLRFGPDAKLYVAFDDAGDPAAAGNPGSVSGKVIRLATDAATSPELLEGARVFVAAITSPRGLGWDPRGTLWIVQHGVNGQERLEAVVQAPDEGQGTTVARYMLPPGTGAAGISYYGGDAIDTFRGNLLVAAHDGRAVLRFRLDATNPHAIVSAERLLGDTIGPIRAVGVAPWGTIYVCTETAVMQIVPDEPARRSVLDR